MDEPQIRYCTTSDGAKIAYYTLGEGAPVVSAPSIWSHVRLAVKLSRQQDAGEHHIAAGRMIVRYDGRGTGSSDRGRTEFGLDARVSDLQAIMDHLRLNDVTLFGFTHAGPTCIAYAALHAERVGHLVLSGSYARGIDYYRSSPSVQGLPEGDNVPQTRWDFFYRMLARAVAGPAADSRDEQLMASIMRESMSPAASVAYRNASREIDVSVLLSKIAVPTLVIYNAASPFGTVEQSQELAAGIRDAHLVVLDGETGAHRAIDEFLGAPPRDVASPSRRQQFDSGTAVILFADIVDSTALTERMGDGAFRERARALDVALRGIIADAGGTTIDAKTLGDGVLATFRAASQAIDAALRCGAAGDEQALPLHLGLHAGDVIREQNNVFGGAVNIASRISGLSAPGEVLVSDIVRGLARTSAGVAFEDRGEHALKGVAEPQRVYAVRKDGA